MIELRLKLTAGITHCEQCWFRQHDHEPDASGRPLDAGWFHCDLFDCSLDGEENPIRCDECLQAGKGAWIDLVCPSCRVHHRLDVFTIPWTCPACGKLLLFQGGR